MKTKAPVLEDVARLVSVITARNDIAETAQLLDDIIQARYGHKLFTLFRIVENGEAVERLHSSDKVAYPARGRKKREDTVWGRVVFGEGNVLISRNAEDIRVNFPDYDVIFGLGINSMINIPVVWEGKVIGSANLSHRDEGFFEDKDGDCLAMLVGIVAPVVASTLD